MLVRGTLVRFTAGIPKTPAQGLLRSTHLVQRRLLSHNGLSVRSRAHRVALLEYRRSYATTTRATKPTPKVKQAVKKAAAEKKPTKTAASKKTTAPKKTAAKKKSVAKKTAAPRKTKRAAKAKPKPKPKRAKKVLSPEEKEALKIREYKKKALSPPTTLRSISAWQLFVAEALTAAEKTDGKLPSQLSKDLVPVAAAKFRSLTPAEREHYNHLANERTAAKRAEYTAWVHKHTPEQIRIANHARATLRRKLASAGPRTLRRWVRLHDDRAPKRPENSFLRFSMERKESGDFKDIPFGESQKLITEEWKSLSASEKKKYDDAYAAEKAAYLRKYEQLHGQA